MTDRHGTVLVFVKLDDVQFNQCHRGDRKFVNT